jgi:DNA excision repair protein ERCC-5
MATAGDTRILTEAEMEEYAKDYHLLEDLSHYDFSALDFDSDYFRSLPPAEQYSILNAARLRSRLRMGYSKEQLDDMFPDRLAFSRFQIQRVKERNNYTQRLMNLNGMNDAGPQRIAGEKGREYTLIRNDGVEGGWVLGTADTGGAKDKPVLLDVEQNLSDDDEADGEFEDVPLENSQTEEPEFLRTIPPLAKKEHRAGRGEQTKLPFAPVKKQHENLFVIDDDSDEEDPYSGQYQVSDDDAELQAVINISLRPHFATPQPLLQNPHTVESSYGDTHETNRLDISTSDESQLNRAIALSLSQNHDLRPTTADSNDSDLQKALEISRVEDDIPQAIEASRSPARPTFEDDVASPQTLFERFPLTAKDKGKGRATSITPEPVLSTEDDELLKVLERSKSDVRGREGIPGVGSSKVSEGFGQSPSRAGNVLGRSMFRKKEKLVEFVATTARTPPQDSPTVEIIEPIRNEVLEEKICPASPDNGTTIQPDYQSPIQEPARRDSVDQHSVAHTPDWSPSTDTLQSPPPTLPSQSEPPIDQPQSPQEDVYFSSEGEDLMAQLAAEAEEHARFTSSINPSASSRPEDYAYTALTTPLTEETYDREMRTLRNQQKRDRRDADEVNQVMVLECQALLRLFGLPYITAPMEAEAQCAELVELGLVDGIVTDDSDIFLFGGTRVYKNMFNQGKFMECYLLGDLQRDFNLDRQKFINLAHLLGSDYAEGIPHVGPVNALELLSEFPNVNGLEDFRDWWIAVQQGRMPKDAGESEFRRKFRKNSTKMFLPMDFPNRIIDQAYLKPEVDHDPQAFVWGVPDLDALRKFLMAQIGWSKERTDEILVPVIKDMNRRQVFSSLHC